MCAARSENPLVYIIILNWNNTPDTLACLASASALDYPNYRLLVVDNGSTDGSADRIRTHYPSIEVLETGRNLGYSEGNNVGIRWALAAGASYVFILNNDTTVAPTMLTELVQAAESRPQLGMAGPRMFCMGEENLLFATGSFIDWTKGQVQNRDMFHHNSHSTGSAAPEQVDFITGCGVLVRRELIEVAGMMDPSYFLNFEDVEWAVRARRHGFEIWYVPHAIMWHKVSATMGQGSPTNTYYFTRNALRFFWHNAPRHLRLISIMQILVTTLRTVGVWSFRPRYRSALFRKRRTANLLAVRDFFLGRHGQMGADVARICYGR